MSADDLDALIDETTAKRNAIPLKRSEKQKRKAAEKAAERAKEIELAQAATAAQNQAARLAQIVNLVIAGHSLSSIAASIGATEAEVERMLTQETSAYVRNQPALRVFVRNYLSNKYSTLLDAVWDDATDKTSKVRFEAQDRSLRILKEMGRLHGADAPTQTEIKVEATPESVEKIVKALAAGEGLDYDDSIFDTVPGTVVHSAVDDTAAALDVSGNAVEESDGHDDF